MEAAACMQSSFLIFMIKIELSKMSRFSFSVFKKSNKSPFLSCWMMQLVGSFSRWLWTERYEINTADLQPTDLLLPQHKPKPPKKEGGVLNITFQEGESLGGLASVRLPSGIKTVWTFPLSNEFFLVDFFLVDLSIDEESRLSAHIHYSLSYCVPCPNHTSSIEESYIRHYCTMKCLPEWTFRH